MAIDSANQAAPKSNEPAALLPGPKWCPSALICLLLVALAFACFGRTLTSYFIADDFGEVLYVSKIAGGRWDMFISNWTGNFMQVPGMAVYRPWLLMTLLVDFIFWHGNSVGFYLTNILYYAGDSIMLFLVCRKLSARWSQERSLLASALAAVLFTVNPLHAESVSWVVGRVDTACCFYYLGGLWSYLHYRSGEKKGDQKRWIALSVLCFWLGMLVKEMAIGLPIVATAISFLDIAAPHQTPRLQPSGQPISQRFKTSFLRALKQSAPLWISTLVYFIVRYLALGTLLGGYNGSIGDGQAASALQRWFDPDTYRRVLLPFAISVFRPDNLLASILTSCYAAIAAILGIKAIKGEISYKLVLFCAIWLVSAALPIYKLWGIGMDLEGARFCFFLTAAGSATIALLALAPSPTTVATTNTASARANPIRPDIATAAIAALALILTSFVLYKACLRSNAVWVHAGKEVKSVMQSAASLAERTDVRDKLIVLGIPKKNGGAHLIYNGATLRMGLEPPFTTPDESKRFLTFDPIFYGPPEYINSARFKACLQLPDVRGPFIWNTKQLSFIDASFAASGKQAKATADPLLLITETMAPPVQVYADGHATVSYANGIFKFTNDQIGDGLQFNNLSVDPRAYDFLQFEYKVPIGAPQKLVFQSKWHGRLNTLGDAQQFPAAQVLVQITAAGSDKNTGSGSAAGSASFHQARIPLSHYWRWYACGSITDLALLPPAVQNLEIKNVALVSDTAIRPTLKAMNSWDDDSGVQAISSHSQFAIDATKIPGAAKLLIECSKPEYFFDQIEADMLPSALFNTAIIQSAAFNGPLKEGFSPLARYSELRVRALDDSGHPVGEYSEPLVVYTSK